MSVIGIDCQQTATILALCEGADAETVPVSVGDGRRAIIPNAVTMSGVWGSAALQANELECCRPHDIRQDGPWRDSPGAELFWQGSYERLYGYLGRVRPTPGNGYRCVLSAQGVAWEEIQSALLCLCGQAGARQGDPNGWRAAQCIPATDAVLSRWLTAPAAFAPHRPANADALPDEITVGVVAVGDSSTQVSAYGLRRGPAGRWAVTARSPAPGHLPVGLSAWQTRLLDEARSRFRESGAAGLSLALQDAALDYAWRLGRADEREDVLWQEAGQERMYAPLRLSRAECAAWPDAQALTETLPNALSDAAQGMSEGRRGTPRLTRVLVGGIGALWPFARDCAARVAPVWGTASPQTDAAFGAASWPDVLWDASLAKPPPRLTAPVTVAASKSNTVRSDAAPKPPVSDAPAPRRSAVDGEEWNAPEPGLVPPWERE